MSDKKLTRVFAVDAAGLARAKDTLEAGGLVAVPTETVYGLAARADSAKAVARIYAAKGRPDFNPLIVHVRDAGQAARFGMFTGPAEELANRYWPGPLTLVLPLRDGAPIAPAVTAGLPSIAVRVPRHAAMRRLLEAVDFPLAAPSANRSGFISPTCAAHVLASLDGRIDMVLDGGPSDAGVESTIVAIRADGSVEELRSGPISVEGTARNVRDGNAAIEAPGQLSSHYSPGKPMRLNASSASAQEFLIGYGQVAGDFSLSIAGDLNEAAAYLYESLHLAERSPKPRIAVAPIPTEGIGRAINDRLARAATPAE